MRTKRIFGLILGAIASAGVIFYFQKNSALPTNEIKSSKSQTFHQQETVSKPPSQLAQSVQSNSSQNGDNRRPIHELTESNFEDIVNLCFQGEPCELKEDAWQLYQKFKSEGRGKITDSLISYLRKELKNPERKEQYKDSLKKMIDDFYQGRDRDFQDAAYYYYLGDIDTSLKLYLEMENKAAKDPNYLGPPTLNIANDLYELHRWSEAITYYQKALDEVSSEKSNGPDQQRQIHFIQDRISELERK